MRFTLDPRLMHTRQPQQKVPEGGTILGSVGGT